MKKLMSLFLSLVLVLSLAACGGNNNEEKENSSAGNKNNTGTKNDEKNNSKEDEDKEESTGPKEGGTIVVGFEEMSGNINPGYYSSTYDGYGVSMVFDSLIMEDREGNYVADAAKEWEVSEDGKSITFTLNEGMTFSDGVPVTAEDVKFSYMILADPSYTGRYGSTVQNLVGFEEFSSGETTEFPGVEVIDELTVKFNFKEALRVNLEDCSFSIMPKHYYGANYTVGDTSSVESITTTPLGSGPYTLEKFQDKEFASFKKRPDYYQDGFHIENVICKFVNMTTDITELTTKQIDLLPAMVEPEKIQQVRDNSDFLQLSTYDRSGYGYIKFNCEAGPTKDVAVRQALYYSFNVQEFVDSYFEDPETGDALAAVQYHPFSQLSWAIDDQLMDELTEYTFDLEKSKSILDEAGWKIGSSGYREKDGEIMELRIAAMPDHDILDTLIPMWQRDWEQGLGVKLNIAYLEFNTILDYTTYNSDANVNEWSLFFLATGIGADPDSVYSSFHSDFIGSGKNNTSRYSNPELDALLDEGRSILDKDEAKPIYADVCKILNDEAVMVPVYVNTYFDGYATKIKGHDPSPFWDWTKSLKDMYVEE